MALLRTSNLQAGGNYNVDSPKEKAICWIQFLRQTNVLPKGHIKSVKLLHLEFFISQLNLPGGLTLK